MLDTNICVEVIRKRGDRVLRRMKLRSPEDLCISVVTLCELEYGAAKSTNPAKNRIALAEFITPLNILPCDDIVTPVYRRIRAALEKEGRTIGPLDTMIAAHAMSRGLTVVTNNEREFHRVPGLKIQNWAK